MFEIALWAGTESHWCDPLVDHSKNTGYMELFLTLQTFGYSMRVRLYTASFPSGQAVAMSVVFFRLVYQSLPFLEKYEAANITGSKWSF